jgi:phage terminase large subunit
MSQLTYKIQSMDARLKKLEKELAGVESLPPFHYNVNPGVLQDMMHAQDSELLVYGGAGTGKTSACMAKIHRLCMEYPGIRCLVARKVKADVAETALKAYEELVLGSGHPLLKGASRFNRRFYAYPNGSKIIVGGMDASSRVMGTDYDLVYVTEANELHLEDWERLTTRLRNNRMPFQQMLADTNPSSPSHFLFKRMQAGNIKYLKSNIEDNPAYFNYKKGEFTKEGIAYLKRFENVTGVRYKQLRLGEWIMAEGAVFEDYDAQRHIIYEPRLPAFRYYIASVDFGYAPGAGVLLVFGVTKDDTMILVHEVYQTRRDILWWLGEFTAAQLKYKPVKFMCDPSGLSNIQLMRSKGIPAFSANNKTNFGFDLIRHRLRTDNLKFWHKSIQNPDANLKDYMQPWRLTEELPGLVYEKGKEVVQNGLPDHATDALRYAVAEVDKTRSTLPVGSSTGHAAR